MVGGTRIEVSRENATLPQVIGKGGALLLTLNPNPRIVEACKSNGKVHQIEGILVTLGPSRIIFEEWGSSREDHQFATKTTQRKPVP